MLSLKPSMERPVEMTSWAAISVTVGHTQTSHKSSLLFFSLPKQIEELQVSFRGKRFERGNLAKKDAERSGKCNLVEYKDVFLINVTTAHSSL